VLIGANVFNPVTGEGSQTNEYGFYSLTMAEGEATLLYSYIGYKSNKVELFLDKKKELHIKLHPNAELDEVVVYGNKSEAGFNAVQMNALDIPLSIVKKTPSLFGEADVMKSIQLMPGVQGGTEGGAGLYVRGGGVDENLILLDGVPLYSVDHLFGFFSVFNPEVVKKIMLFKGSFPARFSGRLSSVIDVRTNDGDMQNYHGTIGIGLLSGKLHFEGPIVKDRTSFNISARRSYLDLLAKPVMPSDGKFTYYFYDYNAKVNHRFNNKSRLLVSLYHGKDKIGSGSNENFDDYFSKYDLNMKWGNFLAATKFNYQLTPNIFTNTTLSYTHYDFNVNSTYFDKSISNMYENNYKSDYSSGIKDLALSVDFDYHFSPRHHFRFGGAYKMHRFNPEVQTSKIDYTENNTSVDTLYSSMADSRIKAKEANVYLEDNISIGNNLDMNLGVHLSLFNVSSKTYTSFQPRISTRYALTDNIALKASYTKMSQYIHLLSSYMISMPTDLWVPTTSHIKPMKADQYSVGGYYSGLRGWELSMEAYYKVMRNVLEYKDGAFFTGSSQNWESKVEMGKGRSMGIEFMAQKTTGKATGWVAYTLAKSDRKFALDGINNGNHFPFKYDRRHHLNAVLNYELSDKIDISSSWEFYTGGTTTLAEEKTLIIYPNDNHVSEANYIEERNNYRMPNSHHLNVGINFNKKTKHGMRTWNVSIYNVYNAMNPTFIFKSTENGTAGQNRTILKKVTILPIIPSVSYIYKF
jgi:outer membrane cobalamin receptor